MTKSEKSNPRVKTIVKAWKDPAFKKKLESDPASALKEMGYEVPPNVKVRLIENSENSVTFVLPAPPQNIGDMEEQELERVAGGFAVGKTSFSECGTPKGQCPPPPDPV